MREDLKPVFQKRESPCTLIVSLYLFVCEDTRAVRERSTHNAAAVSR